jgi:hypothetical protein
MSLTEHLSDYFDHLAHHRASFTHDITPRIEFFKRSIADRQITLEQLYAITASGLLEPNTGFGYKKLHKPANIELPRSMHTDLGHQYGWHYFAMNLVDDSGGEYGALLMFMRRSPYPNDFAAEKGFSEAQDTCLDVQFALTDGTSGEHFQAYPHLVDGANGDASYSTFPGPIHTFAGPWASLEGPPSGEVFPLHIKAKGDGMALDIRFSGTPYPTGKEALLKGDKGCMPVISGIGTYYFSIPMMQVEKGSSITFPNGKRIEVTGTGWLDHQWGSGSAPYSPVLRAVTELTGLFHKGDRTFGWDFLVMQLPGRVSLSAQAFHHFNTDQPVYTSDPGVVKRDLTANYLTPDGSQEEAKGTLTIHKWKQAAATSFENVKHSNRLTWWPYEWEVDMKPSTLQPEGIHLRMESVTGEPQPMSFADGGTYQEAAVRLISLEPATHGQVVGHGYGESFQYGGVDDFISKLLTFGISQDEIDANIEMLVTHEMTPSKNGQQ